MHSIFPGREHCKSDVPGQHLREKQVESSPHSGQVTTMNYNRFSLVGLLGTEVMNPRRSKVESTTTMQNQFGQVVSTKERFAKASRLGPQAIIISQSISHMYIPPIKAP